MPCSLLYFRRHRVVLRFSFKSNLCGLVVQQFAVWALSMAFGTSLTPQVCEALWMSLPSPYHRQAFFEKTSLSGVAQFRHCKFTVLTVILLTSLARLQPVEPFKPIQLIYNGSFLPLLLAPFTLPLEPGAMISRLVQFATLLYGSASGLPSLYAAHLAMIVPRTALAFLFNRAVGWKFPSLFVHSAGCRILRQRRLFSTNA